MKIRIEHAANLTGRHRRDTPAMWTTVWDGKYRRVEAYEASYTPLNTLNMPLNAFPRFVKMQQWWYDVLATGKFAAREEP
jgi:hypothetical protein